MQSFGTTQGRDLRYAVIGRLKKEHDAYSLEPDQICQLIALELMSYVEASDVIYVPPNFIIAVNNPFAQEAILSEPTLETNHFQLQMLPWSKEHEWAQLPWITVPTTPASNVIINPLDILPIVPKRKGCQRLKDSFANVIPKGYDLRAPDFSYLLIVELRNFYQAKYSAFIHAKEIATAIRSIMQDCIPQAEIGLSKLAAHLQPMHAADTQPILREQERFLSSLRIAIRSTDVHLPRVHELADSALNCTDTPLNLEGFKEGPSTFEVPVPPEYAERLKVIYNTAIQKILSTAPIIETIKREENRYETYITIHDFTRRYFGSHTRNAPAMEAQAIYYALKHLTNVQGYSLLDLNYPILHNLVSDIDKWNARINVFEIFSRIGLTEIGNILTNVTNRCQPHELGRLGVSNIQLLTQAAENLVQRLEDFHISIADLHQHLHMSKEAYDAIRIGIYSPSRSVYQWGRAVRPSIASTTNN